MFRTQIYENIKHYVGKILFPRYIKLHVHLILLHIIYNAVSSCSASTSLNIPIVNKVSLLPLMYLSKTFYHFVAKVDAAKIGVMHYFLNLTAALTLFNSIYTHIHKPGPLCEAVNLHR